ncbi:MAG: hypothetical protein FJ151_01870 [Euryarchaeota archaeon]|nr:hypothetical protein [Euryarchaeota archaeon]
MEKPCSFDPQGPVECTTCKKCTATCPADVDMADAVRLQRYRELPRGSHRDLFLLAQKMMARSEVEPWISPSLDTGRDDIFYFPGCASVYDELLGWGSDYARSANAGIALLNRLGISPKIVYGCCGHDLYYSGNLDHFEIVRERLREKVKGRVIVGCAECYHCLKELHGLDAVHISEFIDGRFEIPSQSKGASTFHDPCRLGRYHSIYDAPRNVLGKLSDLREMEHSKEDALCCGVSAWLNCNFLSKENRVRRLSEAAQTGAETLVTACSKCRVHLDCVYSEEKYDGSPAKMRIVDFQEFVADALGIDVPHSEHVLIAEGRRLSALEVSGDMGRMASAASVENAFRCTTCDRCREECDFDFDAAALVEDLRKEIVLMGKNPEQHRTIVERLRATGNAFGDDTKVTRGRESAEYVYFPGCVAVSRRPQLLDATTAIMDALGVEYEMPEGLVCCGSVLKRTGYDPRFLMERNREIIGGRKVIASCAGCFSTLARDYGDIEVVHISQLLKDRTGDLKLGRVEAKVAYHDPCHLGRKMGIYDEPRALLSLIPGISMTEFRGFREKSVCCGGGGGVRSGMKDLAGKLGSERMREAEELGVEIVATSCPFCELNLEENGALPVLDIVEILVRSMKEGSDAD